MSTPNVMSVREQRPNEAERLESELFYTLREMLEQDPNALNRILQTLNRVLEPTLNKRQALT